LDKGIMNNVYFSHVSSNDKLMNKDYNLQGEIKENVKLKSVKKDMDSLLIRIVERLKATQLTKDKPVTSKVIDGWTPVLGKLHKTMIACRDHSQASAVYKYLQNNTKAKVVMSTHKDDYFSEEMESFRNDPDIKVLIVIRRGILGFDMSDLVNVVDMTGSRNIDRIYQLMARTMRKNDQHKLKY